MMEYRREVDGLRALAVVPVILFHAGFQTFSGGFVGVDVFFVISGYLITSIILDSQRAGTFSVVEFYERRARRILPALFFVVLACLPFAWLWLLPQDLQLFSHSLIAVSFYASNILFWLTSGYFDTAAELKPLLHTWSLAVEEQYYLLFPVFLLVMWRFGRGRIVACLVAVALVSLGAAHWAATHRPDAAFYLLPTRCWELLIGSFIAFHFFRDKRWTPSPPIAEAGGAVGVLLLAYAVLAFDPRTPFPSLYTLVPTVGTALVILFATRETLAGKLLGSRLLVGIGLVSYSAYLWHQPLLAFARHRMPGHPAPGVFVALIALTGVLAYLSWRFVEQPFRSRARFGRRQIFAFSAVGSVAMVAIGVAGVLGQGFPGRLNDSARMIAQTSADASRIQSDAAQPPVVGDRTNVRGVLIGDSHAESLAATLGESLARRGQGLRLLTKVGCPPATGLYRVDIASYADACDAHYRAAFDAILRDSTVKDVVVAARFTLYLESSRFDNREGGIEAGPSQAVVYDGIAFKGRARSHAERQAFIAQRITDSIQELLSAGKRVLLVYPIPEVGWNVPITASKLALDTAGQVNLSTSAAHYVVRNAKAWSVLDALGDSPQLVRIFPSAMLCNTSIRDRCAAVVNSRSLYTDSNHLSNAGARPVSEEIAQKIAGER
ncbi:acyltransferase family protein [Pseudorhodoferax sp. Leaf267]|uniref:acyltransferase family protein n=1 Tax=Pseudorhodoferax sp. Leaf267 TaxID=1736316 RepID=UPI0006FACFCC|nr:acyltransferase family protein [Pseudorhodoferax sp. Leaf267]KQP20041.1 hypothetical protein ASF43_28170 [Pseudorhodoferax sp. Leaf267]